MSERLKNMFIKRYIIIMFIVVSDGPTNSKARERRRAAKTPRKSKRMAARLDGHSSGEVESSKSVSER